MCIRDSAERKAETYSRLAAVSGANELALVVKAADRLANVRNCVLDDRRGLMTVYRREHASFRRSAYRAGLCEPLWAELDVLLAVVGVTVEGQRATTPADNSAPPLAAC